jgi:hypothetical protein
MRDAPRRLEHDDDGGLVVHEIVRPRCAAVA